MKIQILSLFIIYSFLIVSTNEYSKDKINSLETISENSNLIGFLKKPINLQKFKEKKDRQYVTTSVQNGKAYYFNPKNEDSIYYRYNYITEGIGKNGINKITVFKYGKNKHNYEDNTETLIELNISSKDAALGDANLVGLSKAAVEVKFGKAQLLYNNRSIYSYKNRILIIEFKNAIITSFRYIALNTESFIDSESLQQILR